MEKEEISQIMERVEWIINNSEGLEVEVLAFALDSVKNNPELSILESLYHSYHDWVK